MMSFCLETSGRKTDTFLNRKHAICPNLEFNKLDKCHPVVFDLAL